MATTTKVIPALPESTIATGDIIYYDTDQFQKVSVSTAGHVLTTVLGKPAWVDKTTVQYLDTTYSCKLRKAAGFPVATATTTLLTFTGAEEIWDDGGYHSPTTNTARITIPSGADGIYRVEFSGWWPSNATGIRGMFLHAKTSGGVVIETAGSGPVDGSSAMATYHHAGLLVDLDAAEYVEVELYQSSGIELDLQAKASLHVVRVAEAQ
jgi:hypothetical protein